MPTPVATQPRSPIDWSALRRRMVAAHALLDQNTSPTAERRRDILRARARVAAVAPASMTSTGTRLELLEFSLLHETYGIETAHVREVAYLHDYLPLPGAPSFVLGITHLHGRMLTIFNLKPFFGLSSQGLTNLNKIIVLEDGATEFGLLADSVSGSLRHMEEGSLQALPPTFTGLRAQFSRGITADSLVVLDARRLLRDSRFNAGPADHPSL